MPNDQDHLTYQKVTKLGKNVQKTTQVDDIGDRVSCARFLCEIIISLTSNKTYHNLFFYM